MNIIPMNDKNPDYCGTYDDAEYHFKEGEVIETNLKVDLDYVIRFVQNEVNSMRNTKALEKPSLPEALTTQRIVAIVFNPVRIIEFDEETYIYNPQSVFVDILALMSDNNVYIVRAYLNQTESLQKDDDVASASAAFRSTSDGYDEFIQFLYGSWHEPNQHPETLYIQYQ